MAASITNATETDSGTRGKSSFFFPGANPIRLLKAKHAKGLTLWRAGRLQCSPA